MDNNNNWRQPQAEPSMDAPDWRTQLQPDSRSRIVNKIMETLKKHLPISGPEGLVELQKIAIRFEEKIYSAAVSQSDYLRKISLKMLTMETKSQNTSVPNSLQPAPAVGNQHPLDSGTHDIQSQVRNQGQATPLPNQSQARSAGVPSSTGLPSILQSVNGLAQTSLPNAVGQGSGLQNISGIPQNSVGNSVGQGIPSNIFSTSIDSNAMDLQEEVYQKVKSMKELYLPELNEMYREISLKIQQHESLPQMPEDQIDRFKLTKIMLECIITFLQLSKNNVIPSFRDKLGDYEKHIVNFIGMHRPKKPGSSLQQGQQQLPPSGGYSLSMQQQHPQQQQPLPSQIPRLRHHDNQMNSQIQPMNWQSSVTSMQPTAVTSIQNGSIPSVSTQTGVSTAQANMMNSLQTGSTLETGQGGGPNSLQQTGVGFLQQNTTTAPQQANINPLYQGVGNAMQPNIDPLPLNSNMLQHQHLRQQQEQQMLQSQQFHARQMQQKLLQQQMQHILQQQLQQPQKQQQSAQLQPHSMSQLHQMNEDLKVRQGMGFKAGMTQQHHSAGQRAAYQHQQLKVGSQFPICPQVVQVAYPQIFQHTCPQIDQQSLLTCSSKAGTPLQSANSAFIVPSPSTTPLAPTPIAGDPEKQASGVAWMSNAGNIGQAQTQAQSLAIGTPGTSTSPLLAEYTSPDGNQGTTSTLLTGKPNATEQPMGRLINVVRSFSTCIFILCMILMMMVAMPFLTRIISE